MRDGYGISRPMPLARCSGRAVSLPDRPRGRRAAIGLINSVGDLYGIVGPVMLGWVKDTTNSLSGGFYVLAFWAFRAGIAVVSALRAPKRVAPGYGAPAE